MKNINENLISQTLTEQVGISVASVSIFSNIFAA